MRCALRFGCVCLRVSEWSLSDPHALSGRCGRSAQRQDHADHHGRRVGGSDHRRWRRRTESQKQEDEQQRAVAQRPPRRHGAATVPAAAVVVHPSAHVHATSARWISGVQRRSGAARGKGGGGCVGPGGCLQSFGSTRPATAAGQQGRGTRTKGREQWSGSFSRSRPQSHSGRCSAVGEPGRGGGGRVRRTAARLASSNGRDAAAVDSFSTPRGPETKNADCAKNEKQSTM